ncbi:MAG: hypothetical protein ACP5PB_06220 [Acidimicrobiales bacterium]
MRGTFDALTVVVAVKESCDGCRDFVFSNPTGVLETLTVLVISAYEFTSETWRAAPRDIVVTPSLWSALDIRSAPFYVLVDPVPSRVVSEGVVFAAEQVAREVGSFLASR